MKKLLRIIIACATSCCFVLPAWADLGEVEPSEAKPPEEKKEWAYVSYSYGGAFRSGGAFDYFEIEPGEVDASYDLELKLGRGSSLKLENVQKDGPDEFRASLGYSGSLPFLSDKFVFSTSGQARNSEGKTESYWRMGLSRKLNFCSDSSGCNAALAPKIKTSVGHLTGEDSTVLDIGLDFPFKIDSFAPDQWDDRFGYRFGAGWTHPLSGGKGTPLLLLEMTAKVHDKVSLVASFKTEPEYGEGAERDEITGTKDKGTITLKIGFP